ncbi:MAG TPA: response regulator, partial [Gaiella sp.]|nr:response regulator [Gaiella sp.]
MGALEPATVVIVDDHPSFRAIAQVVLENDGFAVVGTASDGETGVAAALELAPDILLLDVELPDIDGFVVAERLREAGSQTAIV